MHKIRNDLIFIGALLVLMIVGILCIFLTGSRDNVQILAYYDNECILEASIDEDGEYVLNGKISEVRIKVSDQRVFVTESGCHDQICVHQGSINRKNQTITCLPNHIYIKIVGSKKGVDVEI